MSSNNSQAGDIVVNNQGTQGFSTNGGSVLSNYSFGIGILGFSIDQRIDNFGDFQSSYQVSFSGFQTCYTHNTTDISDFSLDIGEGAPFGVKIGDYGPGTIKL